MLTGIRLHQMDCIAPKIDDRYSRNVKEDMKTAMDLLFQFKEGMDNLHPECSVLIEMLLQNPNRQIRY